MYEKKNEIFHSLVYYGEDFDKGLKHYKYIDKYKSKKGNWVYVYAKNLKNNVKKTVNGKQFKENINKSYDNIIKKYKELTKDNMYVTNSKTYKNKINQISKTKEWQDIIKRNDPEYVTKDENGNKVYKIDDYLLKKKHPILDVIDDMANGRNISFNEITTKSIIAGANDYIESGLQYVGVFSKALATKFKFSQGSYENDKELQNTVDSGKLFVNSLMNYGRKLAK